MSVSYTSALYTEEDEKRERDKLSEEEKIAIQNDFYGRHNGSDIIGRRQQQQQQEGSGDEEEEDEDLLLNEFHLALDAIPVSEKVEYEMAWSESPHLIDIGSRPLWFIRCSSSSSSDNNNSNGRYDFRKAALQIVKYWRMRVLIFGESRAFEPLRLDGAMQDDINSMLKLQNVYRILPNDDYGRTILCVDRTSIRFQDYDEKVFLKLLWFSLHLALQKQSTRENGIVTILINTSSSWDFPSRNLMKLAVQSISDCMPIKVCCRHFIMSSLVLQFVAPVLRYFMPHDLRHRVRIHCSHKISLGSQQALSSELKEFGFQECNLPRSIGGAYNTKARWVDQCERIAKRMNNRKRQRESY